MSERAILMNRLARQEGINATFLPSVKIYKASQSRPREPLCYEQGIIIVGQGAKRVFLGGKMYEYNQDNYLVLSVPIPAECETTACAEEPFLAMTVDIEIDMLNRIIDRMGDGFAHSIPNAPERQAGLFLAPMHPALLDAVHRLLRVLQSSLESGAIGLSIIEEVMFRILCGENASALYALTLKNTHLARIDKALKQIHAHFAQPINVESLAKMVNMSPSAFHRSFKDVTASSPLQYLKKMRLSKARTLLSEQGLRVNEAAAQVGYESATQFSREFKRYYGNAPVEHIGGARSTDAI